MIATLPAADMERADKFYREVLGVEKYEDAPGGGIRYGDADSWFLVYPSEFAGTNGATGAAWRVDDLDPVVSHLRGHGVEFMEFDYEDFKTVGGIMEMPDFGRGAWFYDTERNIIALWEEN
jgi:predicted enzyme related to lactoylglutathione lyase